MHKSALGAVLRASPAHVTHVRSISTLLEPQIRQLRPFDLPTVSRSQLQVKPARTSDPESVNYRETRQMRFAVPRKRLNKTTYASLTKVLYSKKTDIDDIYNQYLKLPSPRPLFLQPAELEQLLNLVMSPALRDKHTINRLLTISEDMRRIDMPLSIKEVNTLIFLVLRDKNWQTQHHPKHPAAPNAADMEAMLQLLLGDLEWPVSTFNIALEYCKGDPEGFDRVLDKMKEKNVQWDAITAQVVFRQRIREEKDPFSVFCNIYSDRDIHPQDINILVWGMLRNGEEGFDNAYHVVKHLAKFPTSDMTNAERLNKSTFKAAKLDRKTAKKKNKNKNRTTHVLSSIEDIPPTPLTDGTFSMLLKKTSSFEECIHILKMARAYFNEAPTKCLIDMYRGFVEHSKWSGGDCYYLTEYILHTNVDHSLFSLELFMAALDAFKVTGLIDPRGGAAKVSEANCLEALRLAKTDKEKQAYIYIYFRRLYIKKHRGQNAPEPTATKTTSNMFQEWTDRWLEAKEHERGVDSYIGDVEFEDIVHSGGVEASRSETEDVFIDMGDLEVDKKGKKGKK